MYQNQQSEKTITILHTVGAFQNDPQSDSYNIVLHQSDPVIRVFKSANSEAGKAAGDHYISCIAGVTHPNIFADVPRTVGFWLQSLLLKMNVA